MKTRIISILMLLIVITTFVVSFASCVAEESIKTPVVEANVFVYDQDECINDEIEIEINFMIKELEEKTEAEVAVVSIPSLNGYSIEEYANKLFNAMGIGKEGLDNGVLLLFSRTDKRVRLETGRGLEGGLNDSKCGRILDDNFVPFREEGDYTNATRNTAIAVLEVIAKEYQVDLKNLGEAKESGIKDDTVEIWIIIVIIILLLAISLLTSSENGSYGGYHGGVSRGSRSYGGFGGGRSGGGGASR